MEEIRVQGQTRIRNVPIAVTPEGFWCCPSPVAFQKTLKAHNSVNKPKTSSPLSKAATSKKQTEKKPPSPLEPSRPQLAAEDSRTIQEMTGIVNTAAVASERVPPKPKIENVPKKVAIEFGEPGTSDAKVVLLGKQGFCVKLSVHRNVLMENSSFFAKKLSEPTSGSPHLELEDCEDVEICVETVGLMYCKEMKQRLIKQSVPRVLRILKVAQQFGFNACVQSCLAYLEAVPWVGEEEEKVVASVLRLQDEGVQVTPVLKRVASGIVNPPKDTLSHIMELVLKGNEEKGRREMKSVVLKLLKENNNLPGHENSAALCNDMIYSSCRSCLDSLLSVFRIAAEPDFGDKTAGDRDQVIKEIALAADNLSWLLDILTDKQDAEKFADIWANQQEMATLHSKLPITTRHHASCITARIFVGIGRGQLLPSKETRQLLLHTWLEPLIHDYSWLQHGCRLFDRKVVEEGIGRTILTLPLEDQQRIMLSWLGSFLKAGDNNCPNLQKAFEVWWRRTFVRPYVEPPPPPQIDHQLDGSFTSGR
uniref:At3g05675-like ankyrin-like domain-containing protein n=1 Tax=Kalanchoe fedtschenkoi TaxID=63787 RepID=A0A7N0T9J3_KALFE